ncbi:hypothetical protein EON78_00660 [bacterium]|nr:MAG: hypothetical protein EON78_00660 [bacterium]
MKKKRWITKHSLMIAVMMLVSACATNPVNNATSDLTKIDVNNYANSPTIKISDNGADISFKINLPSIVQPLESATGGVFSTKANSNGTPAKTSANISKYIVYLISKTGNYNSGGDPLADIVPGTSPTALTSGGLNNVRFSGAPYSAKTYYVAIKAQDSSGNDLIKPNNDGTPWTGTSENQAVAVSTTGATVDSSLVVSPTASLTINPKLIDGVGAKIEAGITVTNGSLGNLTASTNVLSVSTLVSTGLNQPSGIAVDSNGNVYIADTGNNSIKKIDTNSIVTILVNTGLNRPSGIAVDSIGNVYIADTNNNAIKKIDTSKPIGSPGYLTTLVNTGLNDPSGIAVDSIGNVYIADRLNTAIKKLDTFGNITTLMDYYSGLSAPYAVIVDSSGNLYIADSSNSIKKRDTFGNITTLSGLPQSTRIAVDSIGNLYAPSSSSIKKRDTSGNITTIVAGSNSPHGIAVDSSDNLYFTDPINNTINKIND